MKKGEKTRDRLLKCAEKAFSRKGYYETQVSDIVKLAHVAKGTIYQYFKNKEEIFPLSSRPISMHGKKILPLT